MPVRRISTVTLVVLGAVAAGIAVRAWVLATPVGVVDSDEAVWGLMARHVLHGQLTTFYWGQNYGGTESTFVTAAVFWVFGASAIALKLVETAFWAVAAVLAWRVGRRTVGEPAAALGASLFWIWPSYLVWKSIKAHGFYGVQLVLGLAVLLLALRLPERRSRLDVALVGLALGLGWWASPQIAFLAVPGLLWLVVRRPRVLRDAWAAVPTLLLGAGPWLAWNLRHDWNSFTPGPGHGHDTYVDHLRAFFGSTFPTALGVRLPFSLTWPFGVVVGRAATLAAVLAVVVAALRRRGTRIEALLVVALAYPFVYALSPFAWLVEEPRYVMLLSPIASLLVARGLRRAAPLGLALALGLTVTGLVTIRHQGLYAPSSGARRVPADLGPVLSVLRANGQTRALGDYWIAYRLSFESNERVVAASLGQARYQPFQRLVEYSESPAFVFVDGDLREGEWRPRLLWGGYREIVTHKWAVYVSPLGRAG